VNRIPGIYFAFIFYSLGTPRRNVLPNFLAFEQCKVRFRSNRASGRKGGVCWPLLRELNSHLLTEGKRHGITKLGSKRELTFASDQLPALSRVAREYLELDPGNICFAGLRHNTLWPEFMWQRKRPYIQANKRQQMSSWPWAAINAPVEYDQKCEQVGDKHLKV
jgi:hypothetical protein